MTCDGSGKVLVGGWNWDTYRYDHCPGCPACQPCPEVVEEGATGMEREDISGYCYDCGEKEPHTCKGGSDE